MALFGRWLIPTKKSESVHVRSCSVQFGSVHGNTNVGYILGVVAAMIIVAEILRWIDTRVRLIISRFLKGEKSGVTCISGSKNNNSQVTATYGFGRTLFFKRKVGLLQPQLFVYLLMVFGSGIPASGIGRFVHLLFDLQLKVVNVERPTVHVRDMSPLFANDKVVGMSTRDLVPVMPGCRAPTPSKGKQRVGAVSRGKRSIEVKSAVTETPGVPRDG